MLLQLVVNGEAVPESLLSGEYRRLMQLQQNQPESLRVPEEKVRELAEDGVLTFILLRQAARRRHSEPNQKEVQRRLKDYERRSQVPLPEQSRDRLRSDIEDQVRITELEEQIRSSVPEPSVQEARAAYDENPERFGEPEKVHCSHIVRHTYGDADQSLAMKEIMAAQEELNEGISFDEVVKKHSDCNGQSGDLGTFPRGHMVERFEDVVFKLEPGRPSEIFQTEFGYHIAFVHERFPAKVKPFADVQKRVRQSLANERREAAFGAFIEELREVASIERREPAPAPTQDRASETKPAQEGARELS